MYKVALLLKTSRKGYPNNIYFLWREWYIMGKMSKDVRPITTAQDCKAVLRYLKNANEFSIRDYVIFKMGMNCVLRVSDLIHLRYDDIYTDTGRVKKELRITEIKTGKEKRMPLIHVKNDLIEYKRFLDDFFSKQPSSYMAPLKSNEMEKVGTGKNPKLVKKHDKWLFPSSQHPTQHISTNTYYKSMMLASKNTGVKHLGTHTARKTGAYLFYRGGFDDVLESQKMQPRNDIALAMKVLNHSSESSTLHYLGLEQENLDNIVKETVAFDITI